MLLEIVGLYARNYKTYILLQPIREYVWESLIHPKGYTALGQILNTSLILSFFKKRLQLPSFHHSWPVLLKVFLTFKYPFTWSPSPPQTSTKKESHSSTKLTLSVLWFHFYKLYKMGALSIKKAYENIHYIPRTREVTKKAQPLSLMSF